MTKWKIILLISILLLIIGIGVGDYLIYHYEEKITVPPNSSVVVTSADMLVQGQPPALAPANLQEIGKVQNNNQVDNIYSVSQATITNTHTTSFTVLLIHSSVLLEVDFIILGIGLLLFIISALGLFYVNFVKKT